MDLPTIISIIALIKSCKRKALIFIKDASVKDDFLLNLLFRYYLVLNECLDIIEQLLMQKDFLKNDGTFHDVETVMDLQDCISESIETEYEIGKFLSFEIH
tara:strand:- start:30 stop:332 length:303 start_codon:yes stop_codon:yes gene_type:complete